MITAVGGGIIRDILLGDLPPATFVDWRYLTVAALGGLLAFLFSRGLSRFSRAIDVLDAAGLSLFAVTGAGKALELGLGPVQAIILGAVTGVSGWDARPRRLTRPRPYRHPPARAPRGRGRAGPSACPPGGCGPGTSPAGP
jgi:glycine transporter